MLRPGVAGVAAAMLLTITVPASLAYEVPPSPTAASQISSWIGAGLLAAAAGIGFACDEVSAAWRTVAQRVAPLGMAAGAWLLACVVSWLGVVGSPAPGVVSTAAASLAAAALLAAIASCAAAGLRSPSGPTDALFAAIAVAVLLAGAIGVAIGVQQVFAPSSIDGWLVAYPTVAGRASGNLRQSNLLATLLLWAAAVCAWAACRYRGAGALATTAIGLLFISMLLGIVLTASRTGAVGVLLLAAWGAIDRSLRRESRLLLIVAPIAYAVLWWLTDTVSAQGNGGFSGSQRLQETADLSTSRFAIWSQTSELIALSPWTGLGVGEFNFAWTLMEFTSLRPAAFFDHTHNLPLQLIVELGIPLGALVIGLLLYALWRAFVSARDTPGDAGLAKRCAFVMLLLIGVHSLLEYPLWYAYFLFPTAFLWGLCLAPVGASAPAAPGAAPPSPRRLRWPVVAGVLMIAGGLFAAWDYARVSRIFVASDDAPPLEERIRDGRRSVFFAHHADYAWATTSVAPPLEAFRRPTHFLLDTRLMIAWSKALAAHGDVDRARWVAARLAEFKRADAASFFAPCRAPAEPGTPRPFQCEPPERRYTFRDFR